jgi:hypothetical protein
MFRVICTTSCGCTRFVVAGLLCLASVTPSASLAQATAAIELGGSLVALQQLRSQLEGIVNTVDTATANRIRQTELALDQTIAKITHAIDHGYGRVNNTRDQVMGNVATTIVQTQSLVQDTMGFAFTGVNDSLVNAARILTRIPLINVSTYVFAVTPLRFQANSTDRQVQIHGFFPDAASSHPVYVVFDDVKATSTKLKVDAFVNNTFAFELPVSVLAKEGKFVTMTIQLPVRRLWGAYYSTEEVKARVYVDRKAPFKFAISFQVENSAIWASVTAPSPLVRRADSNLITVNASISASEAFSTLINDNATYEMSTAQFAGFTPGNPIRIVGPPCASGCSGSTGTWNWDARTVNISLSAPSCPIHTISPGGLQLPYQCSGGTHADFGAVPTFRVKRRGIAPAEVEASRTSILLGRKSASAGLPLPANWTAVSIRGEFQDDTQTYQNQVRLTSGAAGVLSANDPFFWKAEVQGAELVISTK